MNLRVDAAAEGLGRDVSLLPSDADEDLLAGVALRPEAPDGALAGLAAAIADRRTYRKSFAEDGPDLPLAVLAEAARADGAWLDVITSEQERRVLAEAVAEAGLDPGAERDADDDEGDVSEPRRQGDRHAGARRNGYGEAAADQGSCREGVEAPAAPIAEARQIRRTGPAGIRLIT